MTFHLGQLTMDDPQAWTQDGDQVSAAGVLIADTEPELQAMRQQLLGYVNSPDEPVVPVWAENDDKVDGFYRITAGAVEVPPYGHAAHRFRWTATLQRLADYANPLIESITSAPDVRSNAHSLPTTQDVYVRHRWFAPTSFLAVSDLMGVDGPKENADGPDLVSSKGNSSFGAQTLQDRVIEYQAAPADWYDGAARVEVDFADDGTFHPIAGRQVPNLPADARWRVNNGTVRVSIPAAASVMRLAAERWTGSVWSTPKTFDVRRGSNNADHPAPSAVTILRNSPAEVAIRLVGSALVTTYSYIVDVRLQRGRSWFEVTVARYGNEDPYAFRIARGTVEAATALTLSAITVGLHSTAYDGDAVAYGIITPDTFTNDLTNGRVTYNANVSPARFGVLMSHQTADNGSSVAVAARSDQNAMEYFAALSETVRVTER